MLVTSYSMMIIHWTSWRMPLPLQQQPLLLPTHPILQQLQPLRMSLQQPLLQQDQLQQRAHYPQLDQQQRQLFTCYRINNNGASNLFSTGIFSGNIPETNIEIVITTLSGSVATPVDAMPIGAMTVTTNPCPHLPSLPQTVGNANNADDNPASTCSLPLATTNDDIDDDNVEHLKTVAPANANQGGCRGGKKTAAAKSKQGARRSGKKIVMTKAKQGVSSNKKKAQTKAKQR
jgi:hypothetical protein